MGYHELVSRSLVILNDSRNGFDKDASLSGRTVQQQRCRCRVHAVRPARGIIDTRDEIRKQTRLRLFEITAAIVDKYVPEAERPH